MAKRLFTPGPLSVSDTVRAAMDRDLGSREPAFVALVADVRRRLVRVGGASEPDFTAVLVPGSGTYAVEACVGTMVPRRGKLLALVNGAYGQRIAAIARTLDIPCVELSNDERQPIDPVAVARALGEDASITHVAVVHCETTTGLVNPVEAIAAATHDAGRRLIVDAMSSFGGLPLDLPALGADAIVSSANKCLQGVPGLAFVIARRSALVAARGHARSLSLDLAAQLDELDRSGQFRFTPPTQVLLALEQALGELDAEGGVLARNTRYVNNHARLMAHASALGLSPLLPPALHSPIITSFLVPRGLPVDRFHHELDKRGFILYPGKTTTAQTFRIGTIGHLSVEDFDALADALRELLVPAS